MRADARCSQRQNREQRRKHRHGIDVGPHYAERHVISQDVKGRRIRGVQAQKPDRCRERGQKHRPCVVSKRLRDRRIFLEAAPHLNECARDDVDCIRDGYHHDDNRYTGVRGAEHRAEPACDPHCGNDREQEKDNDCHGPEKRSQENNRESRNDEKHDWQQHLVFGLRGILESPVDDDSAGHVIVHVRVARAGLLQNGVQIIGNLDHSGVLVLGQDESNRHSAHAPILRHEAPGDFRGAERDFPDSRKVGVGERARVVDERLDDQVILLRPAVVVVR